MNIEDALSWLGAHVSRETMERLTIFHQLVAKWQKTINLVAPSTLENAWARHFIDSAQLFSLRPPAAKTWLDLGSGAGFPGLVIAAMAQDTQPDLRVSLVESDQRKSGFLRECARQMEVDVQIHPHRIAQVPSQSADVISARALSNLSVLLDHARLHMHNGTVLIFPKGSSYREELESLPPHWQSSVETIPSVTDPTAVILRMIAPEGL